MKTLKELLKIAASSTIPVLLLGESGAGKEVAARTLHHESDRKNGPFIAVNCGAIPQNLAESTLEGAKKGAFTGAVSSQLGVVRAAEGGSLFLDEIGEMPIEMQSRLLRILQEHTVRPIGETEDIHVDFRLICATNRNLKVDVAKGRFREDLFFRLNVLPIKIPPLRERDDFNDIVNNIWNTLQNESLSTSELTLLSKHSWPGNIRQLKNVLERYALLKKHDYSLYEILEFEFQVSSIAENKVKYDAARHCPNLETLIKTLASCNGNKSKAARMLGISRGSLCYQIKKRTQP